MKKPKPKLPKLSRKDLKFIIQMLDWEKRFERA